jgi:hypothetical protein
LLVVRRWPVAKATSKVIPVVDGRPIKNQSETEPASRLTL